MGVVIRRWVWLETIGVVRYEGIILVTISTQ